RQAQGFKQFQAAPGADTIAVFAPGVIEHVGFAEARAQPRAQAAAKREMLQVETQVYRQARTARPVIVGPCMDRGIVETSVGGRRHEGMRGLPGCRHSVANPALASSHSALSFQTSISVIRPSHTT